MTKVSELYEHAEKELLCRGCNAWRIPKEDGVSVCLAANSGEPAQPEAVVALHAFMRQLDAHIVLVTDCPVCGESYAYAVDTEEDG